MLKEQIILDEFSYINGISIDTSGDLINSILTDNHIKYLKYINYLDVNNCINNILQKFDNNFKFSNYSSEMRLVNNLIGNDGKTFEIGFKKILLKLINDSNIVSNEIEIEKIINLILSNLISIGIKNKEKLNKNINIFEEFTEDSNNFSLVKITEKTTYSPSGYPNITRTEEDLISFNFSELKQEYIKTLNNINGTILFINSFSKKINEEITPQQIFSFVRRGFKKAKEKGYNYIMMKPLSYINNSSTELLVENNIIEKKDLGILEQDNLEKFYKRFGFKEIKNTKYYNKNNQDNDELGIGDYWILEL